MVINKRCNICNKILSKSTTGLCITCFNKSRKLTKSKKYCSCGKEINPISKRCSQCHLDLLNAIQIGKKHPSYTHGKSCKNKKCSICGEKISLSAKTEVCQKCYHKKRTELLQKTKKSKPHCKDCGKELSCYSTKIKRCKSCAAKGELNSNYIHGKSREPYSNDFLYVRRIILKRDKHICQLCSKKGTHVHHIDYNKQNNKEDNLILLCSKCHLKTNYDRKLWTVLFQIRRIIC